MQNKYKKGSYLVFILVILYVGLGQLITGFELDKKGNFTFLTLPPKLEVNNHLRLDLKTHYTILQFQFDKQPNLDLDANDKSNSYTISQKEDWVTIKSTPNNSLSDVPLEINFSKSFLRNGLKRRFIKAIKIKDEDYSIANFYYNNLSHANSNVSIFYPIDVRNISSYLALKVGYPFIVLIIATLLIIFICQVILFAFTIVWPPEGLVDYIGNPDNNSAVTFIDDFADQFAIPLGFLGTMVSIWFSLEKSETDFSSFIQVLEILKVAIFTSVLGLTIKVILIVRALYSKLRLQKK